MTARSFVACLALIALVLTTRSAVLAQTSASNSSQTTKQRQTSDENEDLDAMKADLARMRVLLTQMQNNLGLTTNTTTPLYHQFELDINMWQVMIGQLERRIQRIENRQLDTGK